MNKAIGFFAALLFVFGGAGAVLLAYRLSAKTEPAAVAKNVGSAPEYLRAPEDIPQDKLLTDFTLTERSGDTFDSTALSGAVHVAGFFFAECPSTCRAQNEAVRTLHADYGSKGVRFLSISVDPEKDTPERLREYAQLFNAHPDQWLFLTGDMLYTRRIGAEIYQMHVEKGVHMNRLAIVDKWGKVRGSYRWQDEIEVKKMRSLLDQLLAETEPPEESPAKRPAPAELPEEDNAGQGEADELDAEEPEKGESEVPSAPASNPAGN